MFALEASGYWVLETTVEFKRQISRDDIITRNQDTERLTPTKTTCCAACQASGPAGHVKTCTGTFSHKCTSASDSR